MIDSIFPIILAGGSGTRLWPLSTDKKPKQFLSLLSEHSLLQETILRVSDAKDVADPVVVCGTNHCALVHAQLSQIDVTPSAILLEPFGRNTAPAIAMAALYLVKKNIDPILLVMPSDAVITNKKAFHDAIRLAKTYAEDGGLITFGVIPSRPETGYGYIKTSDLLERENAYNIAEFVEKPDLLRAKQYLEAGNYYWNSGMFMFRASAFLTELKLYAPTIHDICSVVIDSCPSDNDIVEISALEFEACPSSSIDYAIMEHTKRGVMLPLDAGWSDIGSWKAIWECGSKDDNNNVIIGDVVVQNVYNCYIYSPKKRSIIADVSDSIIVETDHGSLVMHKESSESIKEMINKKGM